MILKKDVIYGALSVILLLNTLMTCRVLKLGKKLIFLPSKVCVGFRA